MSNYIDNIVKNAVTYDLVSKPLASDMANEFSIQSTYAVGDYVMHDYKLYKCISAVTTAGNWNSAKWQECKIGDEINGGVKFTAQTLTSEQKAQARNNIGGASQADLEALNAVRYDQAQTLTTAQKTQARANIGAVSQEEATPDAIRYSAQSLTDAQKNQARVNVGTVESTSIAEEFSTSKAYAVGDMVMYDSKLYKFKTAHSAGVWNVAQVDAVSVKEEISSLSNDFNGIASTSYDLTQMTESTIASGWRLNKENGLCTPNSNYRLVKYNVTTGNFVKVISDDAFQFQSTASVPSNGSSNPNRIGSTYGDGEYYISVPDGATYLIVSTTVENSTISVESGVSKFDKIGIDIDNLNATLTKSVDSTEFVEWKSGNLKPNDGGANTSGAFIYSSYVPKNVVKLIAPEPYKINIYSYSPVDDSYNENGMWDGTAFAPYSASKTYGFSEFDMSNAGNNKIKITLFTDRHTAIGIEAGVNVQCLISNLDFSPVYAEIDAVDSKIDSIEDIMYSEVESTELFDWEAGSFNVNNGNKNAVSGNIRTGFVNADFISARLIDDSLELWILAYSLSDSSFIGIWDGASFVSYSASKSYGMSSFDMSNATGVKIRFRISKIGGGDLLPEEGSKLLCKKLAFITSVETDSSLAIDGAPANSKTVGDKINAISNALYPEVPSNKLLKWSQGGFNANSGGEANDVTSQDKSIRTGYIDNKVLAVRLIDDGLNLCIYGYAQSDGTYLGMWDGAAFLPYTASKSYVFSEFDMANAQNINVRLRIRKSSGDSITTSEGNKLLCKTPVFNVDDTLPTEYTGKEISVFDNILCIGDSLMAGGANRPSGITQDDTKASREVPVSMYSIPTLIKKMYGVETTNWGISGSTTESWYSANLNSHPSWSGHDAAILYIGSNDYNYVTSQGMSTEDGATKSYTYLKNIINKLKTDNVGIRIFLCTLNPGSITGAYGQYRIPLIAKMRQIAEEEPSVFLVDLNIYGKLQLYSAYHNGHPTAIGYQLMASDIGSYISWIIKNNPYDFRWIRWIGTAYAVGDEDSTSKDEEDVG